MSEIAWRMFVAVPVAEAVKEAIARFGRSARPVRDFSWSKPDHLHLTLRFFGNVPLTDEPALRTALENACAGIEPFRLRAEGLGQFADRVLWVGLQGGSPGLGDLARSVLSATSGFGEPQEKRAFAPHITIARRKRGNPSIGTLSGLVEANRSVSFGEWEVAHIELIRSELAVHGARHTTLAHMALEPPDGEQR